MRHGSKEEIEGGTKDPGRKRWSDLGSIGVRQVGNTELGREKERHREGWREERTQQGKWQGRGRQQESREGEGMQLEAENGNQKHLRSRDEGSYDTRNAEEPRLAPGEGGSPGAVRETRLVSCCADSDILW